MIVPAPDSSVYLLIATVCGGIATKLVDYFFKAPKTASDITLAERKAEAEADAAMRAELRAEAKRHRDALTQQEAEGVTVEARYLARLAQVEVESERWRARFYELSEQLATGKHAAVNLLQPHNDESETARKHTAATLLQIQSDQSDLEHLRNEVAQLRRANSDLTARIRAQNK